MKQTVPSTVEKAAAPKVDEHQDVGSVFRGSAEGILGTYEFGKPKTPKKLYHYTSANGLLGILNNNKVWFSDAAFLNDGSEVLHGLEIFDIAVRELRKNPNYDIADEAILVRSRLSEQASQYRTVIFCLCRRDNLLNQWRDYGKDVVSYSLEFDLHDMLDKERYSFPISLFPMIYDMDVQVAMTISLCKRLVNIYERLKPETYADGNRLISAAAAEIAWLLYRFKNEAFAAEEEWRFAAFTPLIPTDIRPCFRATMLGAVPYYEWGPKAEKDKLPITHVTVGPSPYAAVSDAALRMLLSERGLDIPTHYSTIPIRR